MAGVKGRSGGPRPNSGGARPGAGRKPKAPDVQPLSVSPLQFLESVMRGLINPTAAQLKAAIAAAKYRHALANPKPNVPGAKAEAKEAWEGLLQ